jgi:conjugal transfer ATP-binding protein TraC
MFLDRSFKYQMTILHPGLKDKDWHEVTENIETSIAEHLARGNTLYQIHDMALNIDLSDECGHPSQTKVISCQVDKWPHEIALWQTPDFFANLLRPEHGLPCSFLMSFTIRGVTQEKMLAKAKAKAKSLNSNANAIQTFLNPGMKDEAKDWNFVYEESSKGNIALLPCFYNLVLFTDADAEREVVAKAISAYRQFGFELRQSRATQWIRYLASLPFFMTEGFFRDFQTLGMIKTLTHYNIANLMPIVADTKGSPKGLLLPTHRHQLAFLDTFDNKNLPITNYNFLTVGSSGAGKSMFQQAQILSGLAMGEMTYVIDLGASYKHLCELVGGTYIDVTNITLNPFTLFDFEGKTELKSNAEAVADYIQIRDLLAIMASPHEPVCDVQKSYLLDAAMQSWQKKAKDAGIDDVLDALTLRLGQEKENYDQRLNDLIILLKKYGTDGVYGKLFNGKTPFVNQSNFVVFEMGGFQSNPDLLMIVMFVMIVIIQGQFYQSPRHIKKRCIIDEAWRFLCEGSNPIAANFIEQGFRTARKHNGGFGVITQYLLDTEKTIQGQAIAASSDIKIIMRQGNFKDYLIAHPNRFSPMQQQMIQNFGDVQGSGFSNLMIEAGNSYSFHRYFADPFTRILFSSSGDEFAAIEERVHSGMSLMDAVKEVSKIFYGEDL